MALPTRKFAQLRALSVVVLGLVLVAFVWRRRPAQLAGAGVTSVTSATPPLAHVSLGFAHGLSPASVIVDVLDEAGLHLGSYTLPGGRSLLEVPLHRHAVSYRVRVTAFYRLPWGVQTRSFEC